MYWVCPLCAINLKTRFLSTTFLFQLALFICTNEKGAKWTIFGCSACWGISLGWGLFFPLFFLLSASCTLLELGMVFCDGFVMTWIPKLIFAVKIYGSNFPLTDSYIQVSSVQCDNSCDSWSSFHTENMELWKRSPVFRTNCTLASANKIWWLRLFSRFFFGYFNLVGTLSDVLDNFFWGREVGR